MEPLDPKLARLVHEGMVQAVPGPEVEARVLQGLLARLSPAGPGGDGPGQGTGPGVEEATALGKTAAGSKALLWVGVLGVTAVAAVIGVSAAGSPKPERNTAAASTPRDATVSVVDATPAASPRPATTAPRDPQPTIPVEARPQAKRPPSSTAKGRRPTEPTREPAAAASPDELAAEIQQIAAADRALAHGDARGALLLARAHAKDHPHGQLGLERDAIELRARCQLGEPGAVEAAAAFVREHAEAPAAAKVRTRCAVAK